VSEHIDKVWPDSPAVRNSPKMIAAAGAEDALAKYCQGEHIAGFVIILAYTDGMVATQSAHLSEEDAKRAISVAMFTAGAQRINGVKDLGE
jgi:hypothetical protein